MQNRPRVSIILPTYNGQRFLLSSIATCLLQTFDDLELVIVDDASTDGTSEIISAVNDPRLVYIKHETNRKTPASLNTGFAASRGDYLTWTSDDNLFTLDAIQKMVFFLEQNPDVDFVYTAYWILDAEDQVHEKMMPAPAEMIQYHNAVGACFMYRRKVYEQIGDYREDLLYIHDVDYWLRVNKQFKMAPFNEPVYFFRVHQDAQTSKVGRYKLEIDAAYLLEPRARSYRLSWMYERYAHYQFCHGEKLKSIGSLAMAIYYQPIRFLRGDIVAPLLMKIPKVFRYL